ncbi:tyrosine-protein phosphatase non-receptor type 23 [Topomyia yanbarensis]|uniref:tyrosine-protein phosphatase non-receptor type 23 n=1 Tax=Topomyia yanbarensis TaxID=2498891 RepID=UPI00273B7674|nr:tyrosine-protein phosphatase non-receptor type 23 [Topomyia yanbarensis]
MTVKVATLVLLLLLVSTFCAAPAYGGLLRTPKVYNAVITTDENLTPSRAYPVVQPVVHETGLTYPFGGFGPFGLYNALNGFPGFYQPQPPPVGTSAAQNQGRNAFYTSREAEPLLQDTPIETIPGAKPYPETNLPLREAPVPEIIPEPNNSIAPKAPEGPRPNFEPRPADPKNQLQLNEFGYPPSLIPLTSYNGNGQNPPAFNIQGYPYNFPVLYDSFGNYNPAQYQSVLPPFGYFPQLTQPNPYFTQNITPNGPAGNAVDPLLFNRNGREQELQAAAAKENLPDGGNGAPLGVPEPPPAGPGLVEKLVEDSKSEGAPPGADLADSIKNNANKNQEIPDVPPPPIPSGAKEAEQL